MIKIIQNRGNFTKVLVFFIFLFFLLIPYQTAYSQENNQDVKVSVLPFEYKSNYKDYKYLKYSIQSSIHDILLNVKGIQVVSNDITNEIANEIGLTLKTLYKKSITGEFSDRTGTTIIVAGNYKINLESENITTEIIVYSINKAEVIISLLKQSEIKGVNLYDSLDNISTSTKNIIDDIRPIKYVSEPYIKSINTKGVTIVWETDKETNSTLHISTTNDFSENTFKIKDSSSEPYLHEALLDYNTINPKTEYYYKSIDIEINDLTSNRIFSKTQKINEMEVYNVLLNEYEANVSELYESLEYNFDNNLFTEAYDNCEDIYEHILEYEKILDLAEQKVKIENLISKFDSVIETRKLINDARNSVEVKDFEDALNKYEEALSSILENNIENIIPKEPIEDEIRRMKAAIEATNLIDEGDGYYNNKEYKNAEEKYNESNEIVTNEEIEDLVDTKEIQWKVQTIPDEKPYIKVSTGYTHNLLIFAENTTYNYVGNWFYDVSIVFRVNKFFSYGFGINYIIPNAFINLSLWNFKSSELFFKVSGMVDLLPILTGVSKVGLGLQSSIGFIWRFGWWGIIIESGAWSLYHFDERSLSPTLNAFVILGLKINI